MWKFGGVAVLILSVFLFTGVTSQNATTTSIPTTHITTTVAPITTASPETTIHTTTVEPTTSTKTTTPTKTTTVEPTTTPKTTTVEPTTPAKTTVPPTTTKAPVTTVAPIPKPEVTDWNVTDGNLTCIRAELAAYFTIPVNGKDVYVVLEKTATTAESTCSAVNGTQELVIKDAHYELAILFVKDSENAYVRNISFSYNLPHDVQGEVHNDSKLFSVKVGNSYLCTVDASIPMENVTLIVSHVKIMAFGKEGNTGFSTAEECDSDNTVSDIVPIAVGCALAALIVVVLIAYLVGRRRSRQKGYQSV